MVSEFFSLSYPFLPSGQTGEETCKRTGTQNAKTTLLPPPMPGQALQGCTLFARLPYLASPPCARLETVETRSLRFVSREGGWAGNLEPAMIKSFFFFFFFCIFLPLFFAGCYQIAQLRRRRMLSHAIHLALRMHGKLFKVARVECLPVGRLLYRRCTFAPVCSISNKAIALVRTVVVMPHSFVITEISF